MFEKETYVGYAEENLLADTPKIYVWLKQGLNLLP